MDYIVINRGSPCFKHVSTQIYLDKLSQLIPHFSEVIFVLVLLGIPRCLFASWIFVFLIIWKTVNSIYSFETYLISGAMNLFNDKILINCSSFCSETSLIFSFNFTDKRVQTVLYHLYYFWCSLVVTPKRDMPL